MHEDWLLATQIATEIATVLVVPLTSNVALEAFPGNVLVPMDASDLGKELGRPCDEDRAGQPRVRRPVPVGRVPSYVLIRLPRVSGW
jgi:mRNA interferase MazF